MLHKTSEDEGFVDKGNACAKGCGTYHRYSRQQSNKIARIIDKLKTMKKTSAEKYIQKIKKELKKNRYQTRSTHIERELLNKEQKQCNTSNSLKN